MAQNIFVSFNFTDRKVTKLVKQMISSWQGDIAGHIIQAENDVSYNGDTAIAWELDHILSDCDGVLFILGEHAQNSPWLEHEIAQAQLKDLPVFVVKLPDTDSPAPSEFHNNKYIKLGWDSSEIAASLNRTNNNNCSSAA